MNLSKDIKEILDDNSLASLFSCVFLIVSGYLVILFFDRDLFLKIDALKLILLSFSFAVPLIFINIPLFNTIFPNLAKEPLLLKLNFTLFVLELFIFLLLAISYLFNLDFRTFLIISIIIELNTIFYFYAKQKTLLTILIVLLLAIKYYFHLDINSIVILGITTELIVIVFCIVREYFSHNIEEPKRPQGAGIDNVINNAIIIEDIEVKNIKNDALDRKKIVSKLVKIIKNDHSETFTILLDGAWGEGKSSIINFVKEKIHDENFLFFEFNPWFFANKKSTLGGFFEELQKKYNFLSESKFLKEIITQNSETLFKIKLPLREEDGVQILREKISKKLIDRKQKLIIVIDDIDRLPRDKDILEVFKIIGIFQKLKNIVIIVSFDREIVQAKLTEVCKKDENYLEKLINHSFKVATRQDKIDEYFLARVKELFSDNPDGINAINEAYKELSFPLFSIPPNMYKIKYWRFDTLREVKHFLYSFFDAYQNLTEEVNVGDLFKLMVLKTFYIKVYNDIRDNKSFYLPKGGMWVFSMASHRGRMEETEKTFIQKEIGKLIKNFGDDRYSILGIILDLFPELREAYGNGNGSTSVNYHQVEAERRVCHPDYFDKYFLEDIPEGEIRNSFVIDFIRRWDSESLEKKKELYSPNYGGYIDFLRKIYFNIDKIDNTIFDKFIKENYTILPQENDDGTNDNYGEIFSILFSLLDRMYPNSFENPSNQSAKLAKMIEIVNNSGLYFANYFIDRYKNKSGYNEDFVHFQEVLSKILQERIEKELFVDKKDILGETKDIIRFTRLIGINFENTNRNKRIEEYLNAMFNKDYKNLIKLLEFYIKRRDTKGGIYDFARMFNINSIVTFINENLDVSLLSNEERKLIDEFNEERKKIEITSVTK